LLLRTGFWLLGDYRSTPWLGIIFPQSRKDLPHPKENIMRSLVARMAPAIVIAVGAIMLGNSATANAAPKEWDIGAYDACIDAADSLFIEGKINSATHLELTNGCCINSGGVLGPPPENLCSAPAANRVPPSKLPTQTLTPALATAPPGDITQTFAPAP
jgi:hypothetical protein